MSHWHVSLLLVDGVACLSVMAAVGADLTLWILGRDDEVDRRWLTRVEWVSFAVAVGAALAVRLVR